MSNKPLTNKDLQKIYDSAKRTWQQTHVTDFEPHLFVVYCYIKAYCSLNNLPIPLPENRDLSAQIMADD